MKTARQWFRAVKRWGVGDEVKCTRRDFTRWKAALRWNRRLHGKALLLTLGVDDLSPFDR